MYPGAYGRVRAKPAGGFEQSARFCRGHDLLFYVDKYIGVFVWALYVLWGRRTDCEKIAAEIGCEEIGNNCNYCKKGAVIA